MCIGGVAVTTAHLTKGGDGIADARADEFVA